MKNERREELARLLHDLDQKKAVVAEWVQQAWNDNDSDSGGCIELLSVMHLCESIVDEQEDETLMRIAHLAHVKVCELIAELWQDDVDAEPL